LVAVFDVKHMAPCHVISINHGLYQLLRTVIQRPQLTAVVSDLSAQRDSICVGHIWLTVITWWLPCATTNFLLTL